MADFALLRHLAVADRPPQDRLDARTRSRARTCAGVTPSLEPHDPRSPRPQRLRAICSRASTSVNERYGPRVLLSDALYPKGIPVPISYPGTVLVIFSRTKTPKSTLRRASASACHAAQDHFGSSNMRATLLTHAAGRVGRLISAKRSDCAYLIRRTMPQNFTLPKNDAIEIAGGVAGTHVCHLTEKLPGFIRHDARQ